MASLLNELTTFVARPILAVAVLAYSVAFSQCPDDGKTFFCEVDKGFNGVTFLGDDSYQGFFVGSKFRTEDDSNRVIFWVDDLRLEWRLVGTEAFHPGVKSSKKQKLNSYFKFEIDYINDLKRKKQIQVNDLKLFKPISVKGERGEQTFQIMKAVLGKKGDQAPQYWVAASHPRGVVLLSVVQTKMEDARSVNRFIDSYMIGFGGVDVAVCETIRKQQPQSQ
jgi:hypothetical protein